MLNFSDIDWYKIQYILSFSDNDVVVLWECALYTYDFKSVFTLLVES